MLSSVPDLRRRRNRLQTALQFGKSLGMYRQAQPTALVYGPKLPRKSARGLTKNEREEVLDMVNSEEFQDKAPAEIHATLLDRDRYLCSERSMYRILADNAQVRERRNLIKRPRVRARRVCACKCLQSLALMRKYPRSHPPPPRTAQNRHAQVRQNPHICR